MKIETTSIRTAAVICTTILLICLTSCNQKAITFKAALVYKMGGAQPVARTKFYLLKKDLEAIGKEKNTPVFVEPAHARFLDNLEAGIQEEDIKEFIIATTTTDFEGNGKFTNVPSGVYYIAGSATTQSKDGYAVWSVMVDTEQNKDAVLIDQNNAFDMSNY